MFPVFLSPFTLVGFLRAEGPSLVPLLSLLSPACWWFLRAEGYHWLLPPLPFSLLFAIGEREPNGQRTRKSEYNSLGRRFKALQPRMWYYYL